jgi:hypothetical protein
MDRVNHRTGKASDCEGLYYSSARRYAHNAMVTSIVFRLSRGFLALKGIKTKKRSVLSQNNTQIE